MIQYEFRVNWFNENHTCLSGVSVLCPHFPHLVSNLGDLRLTFLTICNFHDNGLSVDRPVLWEYIELL
jgi:hypothetical protein